VESVLAQDYPHLEHLLLDDGSDDGTPALVDEFAARYPGRIRAFHHQNRGQAATINRGFDEAEGQVFSIVNSDDPVLPGLFTAVVGELVADPQLAGVYPDFLVIDEAGETLTELHPPDFSLAEMLRLGDNYLGPGVVFTRAMVDAVGGWSADYTSALDLDFWLRGALFGPYGHVPQALATWRSHQAAKTVRDRMTDESIQERFRILDSFFARADVPDEVRAVRQEAYRNLHVITALALTPEVNAPEERFVIHDRYARVASRGLSVESEIVLYRESLERSMAATEASQRTVAALMAELEEARSGAGGPDGAPCEQRLVAAEAHARAAEARARAAEAQLAAVAASPSWRLTAPLRWVRRAGGAVARRGRSRS
jgi:hypothetical protein